MNDKVIGLAAAVSGILAIVFAFRRFFLAPEPRRTPPVIREAGVDPYRKGTNPLYLGTIGLCFGMPILSYIVAMGKPRGQVPHGLFMLGLLVAGLSLFLVGLALRHRYSRGSVYLVPLIIVLLPLAVGFLFIANFGANFSL